MKTCLGGWTLILKLTNPRETNTMSQQKAKASEQHIKPENQSNETVGILFVLSALSICALFVIYWVLSTVRWNWWLSVILLRVDVFHYERVALNWTGGKDNHEARRQSWQGVGRWGSYRIRLWFCEVEGHKLISWCQRLGWENEGRRPWLGKG